MEHRKSIMAKKIDDRILAREFDEGATTVELTGIQGSGKTSLFHFYCNRIRKRYPKEPIFWRDSLNSPIQYNKIGNGGYTILVEEGHTIRFVNTHTNKDAELSPYIFSSFDDLMQNIQLKKINAVYFKKLYTWIDFIKYLRLLDGWQSLFIDEYEDVCPQRSRGEQWHRNEWLANNMKQLRKQGVSFFGNTQSIMDVDFRVRSKIMIYGYLFGARTDQLSPIHQRTVANMPLGMVWWDWGHSIFGQMVFPPYKPIRPVIMAIGDEE